MTGHHVARCPRREGDGLLRATGDASPRLTLVVAGAGWGKSTMLRAAGPTAPSIEVTPAADRLDAVHARPPDARRHRRAHRRRLATCRPIQRADSTGPPRPDRRPSATNVCAAAAAVTDDTLIVLDDVDVADDDPLVRSSRRSCSASRHGCTSSSPAGRSRTCASPAARRRRGRPDRGRGPRRHPADVDGSGSTMARGDRARHRRATGGWPLAVHLAVEPCAAGTARPRRARSSTCSLPTPILFDYLAEDVLANLSDPERDLLVLAAHVPVVRAACSTTSAAATSPPTSPG